MIDRMQLIGACFFGCGDVKIKITIGKQKGGESSGGVIMHGIFVPTTITVVAEGRTTVGNNLETEFGELLMEDITISSETQNKPYIEMDYNLDIVAEEDWANTFVGEYPIDILSEEWNSLSYSEATAACDMPMEYAESLTTDELVEYALNYPFLMDILAYDNIEDGMNHLANKSSVFEELFSRTDCYDELLNEYLELEIDYIAVTESNDMCKTNYDKELFVEAYIGLNYDLLSDEQVKKFVEEYGNNFSIRNIECQDSALAMIFYEAVEEKMGSIPEEAVPESVASAEVCAASNRAVSATCNVCGASLSYTSISVKGKSVYCYRWISGGYSATDIANLDKYIANYHPTFSKVRSASSKYNCHSYAWYSTASTNIYWIENPSPIYNNTLYWTLWHAPMRNWQSGDRVTFWSGSNLLHSAIVNSSTSCTSKLGHYGVYTTTISEMESFYGSSSIKAYIP